MVGPEGEAGGNAAGDSNETQSRKVGDALTTNPMLRIAKEQVLPVSGSDTKYRCYNSSRCRNREVHGDYCSCVQAKGKGGRSPIPCELPAKILDLSLQFLHFNRAKLCEWIALQPLEPSLRQVSQCCRNCGTLSAATKR